MTISVHLETRLRSCRSPDQQWLGRIQGHLDRMQQHRAQVFDEQKKRPAPVEPTDGLDNTKRQRLDANISTSTPPVNQSQGASASSGPVSLAQLFTLTSDPGTVTDISGIPKNMVDQIIVPLMRSVDRQRLDVAINAAAAVARGYGKGKGKMVHYSAEASSPSRVRPETPEPAPPEEVLARSGSEVEDTSAGAAQQAAATTTPSTPPPQSDVIMRGTL